ncbi:PREDICTED: protein SDE2 homolog [Nelumbo nucifera]|uniref:Protein SDE2 homolog n=1 Tax=Nelumbo nucifera TaxID=4432 RepID=A0A1U8AGP1_NELNU|nr:PREDICTED: protein SDE2 homolog [Nelumbo nucifera]
MAVFHLFVRLLDGRSCYLEFPSPTISGDIIKTHLHKVTNIPPQHQRLCSGVRNISEDTLLTASLDGNFPTIHLLLRLLGGKGGFGSLLRGAATKAGQKKTNNFDACRDMSGRRLRHVNAEKKLEEWKAEVEERKLEKIAEDFLKKKAKAVKKSGSGDSEKYIEKYREDSAKCMEEIEASVRESFRLYENSKRKDLLATESASKRLKIWTGKRNVDESDSDDEEDEDEIESEEEEKSVVLDDGCHERQNKDGEGSSGSVSDGQSSGGTSPRSNLDEENDVAKKEGFDLGESSAGVVHSEPNDFIQPELGVREDKVVKSIDALAEDGGSLEPTLVSREEMLNTNPSHSGVTEDSEKAPNVTDSNDFVEPKHEVHETGETTELEKPLNFDNYQSAAEMEVLGMERLKTELQTRGLKCGGTLQERAARLFLLKTTPLEMLPKKLLAKK